ncbi:TPA: SP_0924 family bacteriocin-like peptide, partial [Streptococcus pneumoniae]
MILMTKNINLTNEELELIQGGADSYGKNPNGRYDWEIEPVLTLPVHGFCS